jgi:Winged helix DNA-binding domain
MPRAALLSIHARVEGVTPTTWEDPSLVQVWGPRFHVYVVAARDLPVFTLARLPEGGKIRIGVRDAETFDDLAGELLPVRTPLSDAWILRRDEATIREPPASAGTTRLLPSGDAYTLGVTSEDRALLVPDAALRGELWTPRVWPGALLVGGKVVGTWASRRGTDGHPDLATPLPRGPRGGHRGGRVVAAAGHGRADGRRLGLKQPRPCARGRLRAGGSMPGSLSLAAPGEATLVLNQHKRLRATAFDTALRRSADRVQAGGAR